MTASQAPEGRSMHAVTQALFQQVYGSPASLPRKERWMMSEDGDVHENERVLGLAPRTIGAPLWASGDIRLYPQWDREMNWPDKVSHALGRVHAQKMLDRVILCDRKFAHTEVPRAIGDLACHICGTEITDLRNAECHNWTCAVGALRDVIRHLNAESRPQTAVSLQEEP